MADSEKPTITEYRARADQVAAALVGAVLKARAPLEAFTAAVRAAVAILNDRLPVMPEVRTQLDELAPLDLAVAKVEAGVESANRALLELLTASSEITDEALHGAASPPPRQMTLPRTVAKPKGAK